MRLNLYVTLFLVAGNNIQLPFGEYDNVVVKTVTTQWYALLDTGPAVKDRTGKVTVQFYLSFDGSVDKLAILENTAGTEQGNLSKKAIQNAAPFPRWSADMQRMIGTNSRQITFTFYYY